MARFLALLLASSLVALPAVAKPDAAQGRKLVEEKGCEGCHARKFPGAGAIYTRKDRRVTSWEKLKSQVALCNSELNLQLFPDEEEHVAEHLDRAWYHFRK